MLLLYIGRISFFSSKNKRCRQKIDHAQNQRHRELVRQIETACDVIFGSIAHSRTRVNVSLKLGTHERSNLHTHALNQLHYCWQSLSAYKESSYLETKHIPKHGLGVLVCSVTLHSMFGADKFYKEHKLMTKNTYDFILLLGQKGVLLNFFFSVGILVGLQSHR